MALNMPIDPLGISIFASIHPKAIERSLKHQIEPDPYLSIVDQSKCMLDILPSYGQVGYIIHADGSYAGIGVPDTAYRYFLTLYTLSPRIVDLSSEHRWIIANPSNSEELDKISSKLNAKMVKKCGPNSAVLERTGYP